jgi:hypothetical protein
MRLKIERAQPRTRKKFRRSTFTRVSEPRFGYASAQEAHDDQHEPMPEEVTPEPWHRRLVRRFTEFMKGG